MIRLVFSGRTSLAVLHLAVVSLRLGEDAGGGGVPLQLVHAAVGCNAAKDGSALQISCRQKKEEEEEKRVRGVTTMMTSQPIT